MYMYLVYVHVTSVCMCTVYMYLHCRFNYMYMYMYLKEHLLAGCRYEKRQALKARFEIEQKLRRERKAKKTRLKDKKDDKRLQLIREKRSKLQDKRSKAIDELKAKRSAGVYLLYTS